MISIINILDEQSNDFVLFFITGNIPNAFHENVFPPTLEQPSLVGQSADTDAVNSDHKQQ